MALEYVSVSAGFGSLTPWMTQVGCFEFGESRALLATRAVAAAEVQGSAAVLAALRVSERLLRQFFDDSPISVAVFDPAGQLLHVNRAFGALLGYALEELKDRNIDELVYPDDVPSMQERRRMLVDGRCDEFQLQTRFGSGCRREVCTRMSGRLERNAGDRIPRIFAHIVDVSELDRGRRDFRRETEEIRWKNWDPERYL